MGNAFEKCEQVVRMLEVLTGNPPYERKAMLG